MVLSNLFEFFPGSTNRSVFFCCVYRPPSTPPVSFFDNLLLECESDLIGTSKIVLMVDFNCDCLSPQTKMFNQFSGRLQLQNLTTKPTRFFKDKVSMLDLIISNQASSFSNTKVSPFTGSDHHLVYSQYYPHGIKIPKPDKYMNLRSYRKLYDSETIEKCLNCLYDVLQIPDVDSCVECFNSIITSLLDLLCPIKSVRGQFGLILLLLNVLGK